MTALKKDSRPVFQAVLKYRYPVTAIVSVLHRISGVILFFCIPLLLWMLGKSLASADGFSAIQLCLQSPLARVVVWLILAGLLYHLVAGIRHLLSDAGVGESVKAARRSAYLVFLITIILLITVGVLL
jgi:succinate dehydrogenase / fumarate reductase cytochrome b subunit